MIPRKVVGKFSIRLVPDMIPEVVSEQVCGDAGRECGQGSWGARGSCRDTELKTVRTFTRAEPPPDSFPPQWL